MQNSNPFIESVLRSLDDIRPRAKELAKVCDGLLFTEIIDKETHVQLKMSCIKAMKDSITIRDLILKGKGGLNEACKLVIFISDLEIKIDNHINQPAVSNRQTTRQNNKDKDHSSKTAELAITKFEKLACQALKKHSNHLVELRKRCDKLPKLNEWCSDHISVIRQRMERIEDELSCETQDYIHFQLEVLFNEMQEMKEKVENFEN